MVKKLHIRLIKAFVGPFLASFAITMFLFLMHFIWLYIDDLVGKGLSSWIIIKLLALTTATLVPMALPLAVLLSALMAYGNLAEHFEIVAIKSSGISLMKTLWPNFLLILIISIGSFFFVNNVIPIAMLESRSLLWDVRQKKPAFNIEDGIFYNEIDGYSIKIGRKEEDNETIHDVIIYEQKYGSEQINVIRAKKGRMFLSANKRLLHFNLNDGVRYQEMTDEKNYYQNYPSNITAFKKQEMAFDLSALDMKKTDKELFKSDYRMMSLNDLRLNRDSMTKKILERNSYQKDYLKNYYKAMDTTKYGSLSATNSEQNTLLQDSARDTMRVVDIIPFTNKNLMAGIDTIELQDMLVTLKSTIGMQKDICDNTIQSNEDYRENRTLYTSEMHKKMTLSVLIIILFFIAAPLGTIIRKGGLGMPLVISVLMFIMYYVISLSGEKMAKESVWSMEVGMWLANIVFLPLAVFITYKASIDSALFDSDIYRKLFRKFRKTREAKNSNS